MEDELLRCDEIVQWIDTSCEFRAVSEVYHRRRGCGNLTQIESVGCTLAVLGGPWSCWMHVSRVGCPLAVPDVLLVVPDTPWLCLMQLGRAGCSRIWMHLGYVRARP